MDRQVSILAMHSFPCFLVEMMSLCGNFSLSQPCPSQGNRQGWQDEARMLASQSWPLGGGWLVFQKWPFQHLSARSVLPWCGWNSNEANSVGEIKDMNARGSLLWWNLGVCCLDTLLLLVTVVLCGPSKNTCMEIPPVRATWSHGGVSTWGGQ